jgi:hypothetical protein
MIILQLLLGDLKGSFESPICFSYPFSSAPQHQGSQRQTLNSPFIQCLERVWDLAQSLKLDMGLSRDFTFLPIWFDIFELFGRELGE